MVNQKAQMKIQQMAFMLIAITIFFVLVGLFVLSMTFSDIKSSKLKLDEKNAYAMVSKLANSPELSCGNSFGTEKTNCVDFDKAMVLKNKGEIYSKFWSMQGLEILKIYPSSDLECDESNYPDCGLLTIFSPKNQIGVDKSSFVTLCRKEGYVGGYYNKCELAKLVVRVADES